MRIEEAAYLEELQDAAELIDEFISDYAKATEEPGMNLYLVERTDEGKYAYDEYDSMVVFAKNRKDALGMQPMGEEQYSEDVWMTEDNLKVTLLGSNVLEHKEGVVLASFNAG